MAIHLAVAPDPANWGFIGFLICSVSPCASTAYTPPWDGLFGPISTRFRCVLLLADRLDQEPLISHSEAAVLLHVLVHGEEAVPVLLD